MIKAPANKKISSTLQSGPNKKLDLLCVGDFAIDTHKISHQSVDPSDPDETPVIDQGNLSPILMLPDRRKLLAILRIDRTKYSIHNVGE